MLLGLEFTPGQDLKESLGTWEQNNFALEHNKQGKIYLLSRAKTIWPPANLLCSAPKYICSEPKQVCSLEHIYVLSGPKYICSLGQDNFGHPSEVNLPPGPKAYTRTLVRTKTD